MFSVPLLVFRCNRTQVRLSYLMPIQSDKMKMAKALYIHFEEQLRILNFLFTKQKVSDKVGNTRRVKY